MYPPSGHSVCCWLSFSIRTDWEKFRIESLAHQWILCSEWVPWKWELKQLIKTITIIHSNPHHSSPSVNVLWSEKLHVDLDSRSDGTHSLQRIHSAKFSRSALMKKTHLHLSSSIVQILCFVVIIDLWIIINLSTCRSGWITLMFISACWSWAVWRSCGLSLSHLLSLCTTANV